MSRQAIGDADARMEPKRRGNNADASDERKRRKLNKLGERDRADAAPDFCLSSLPAFFVPSKRSCGRRRILSSVLSLRRFRSSLASALLPRRFGSLCASALKNETDGPIGLTRSIFRRRERRNLVSYVAPEEQPDQVDAPVFKLRSLQAR
jgi:hypothetical protein